MKTDGIIFDLDGTLWSAIDTIIGAWNDIIASRENLRPPLTLHELSGYMGTQLPEIAAKMFPQLSRAQQAELIAECCDLEHERLEQHGGTLYPNLVQTLDALKKAEIPLFIVSNCEAGYIECFLEANNLAEYFIDFQWAGNLGRTKGENNLAVIERNGLKNAIYVGDTQSDAQSAKDAGIPFVFASYGFGQVHEFSAKIDSLPELLQILEL